MERSGTREPQQRSAKEDTVELPTDVSESQRLSIYRDGIVDRFVDIVKNGGIVGGFVCQVHCVPCYT